MNISINLAGRTSFVLLCTLTARVCLAQIPDAAVQTSAVSSIRNLIVPTTGEVDINELHKTMAAFAKNTVVYVNSTDANSAKLQEKPIFRWANPERSSVAGNMYLWTVKGRPHASLGVWCVRGKSAGFEMQSFCESEFKVKLPDQSWSATKDGLKFAELPGKEHPAKSTARRNFQMRNIMQKRFRADLFKYGKTSSEKLRLLPRPIYTYEELPDGVLGGAMYSFAMGTDPEVLVILEARQPQKDRSPQWFYAFAPSTIVTVRGFLDDEQVFQSNHREQNPGTFLKGF